MEEVLRQLGVEIWKIGFSLTEGKLVVYITGCGMMKVLVCLRTGVAEVMMLRLLRPGRLCLWSLSEVLTL